MCQPCSEMFQVILGEVGERQATVQRERQINRANAKEVQFVVPSSTEAKYLTERKQLIFYEKIY